MDNIEILKLFLDLFSSLPDIFRIILLCINYAYPFIQLLTLLLDLFQKLNYESTPNLQQTISEQNYPNAQNVFNNCIINDPTFINSVNDTAPRSKKTFLNFNRNQIRDSHNIMSVTNCGFGHYTFNLITPVNDNEYNIELLSDKHANFKVTHKSRHSFDVIFDTSDEVPEQFRIAIV